MIPRRGRARFSKSISAPSPRIGVCWPNAPRRRNAPPSSRPMATGSARSRSRARWRRPAAGCFLSRRSTRGSRCAGRSATGSEIAVLNGPFPGTAAEFVAHDLIPVLNHPGQIAEWAKLDLPLAPIRPQAGGSGGGSRPRHPACRYRDGAARSDAARVCRLCRGPAADRLARGDQPSGLRRRTRAPAEPSGNGTASPPSQRGFPACRRALRPPPASFSERRYHFDLVRPGAALYGVNPLPGRPNPLRPVVRLDRQNHPDARN